MYVHILDPPVIDNGLFVPRPPAHNITSGNKTVKIGTPVYVRSGFDVIIHCELVRWSLPITNHWFRNRSPYPTRQSVSNITITDANNGDVITCKVTNSIGSDIENTTIYVEYGKYVRMCVKHMHRLQHSREGFV